MTAFERVCLVLLFIGCFLLAELIVDHLLLVSPFQRFVARVGFQVQLCVLVYLLFDARDMSRRLRRLEDCQTGDVVTHNTNVSSKTEGQE